MAHFAEIDENNIVVRVVVIPDEQEHRGAEYLSLDLRLGGTWLQTSINTEGGVHKLGKVPLRMNYAGIGATYDPERDAFIPVQPAPNWILNQETLRWQEPPASDE